MFLHVAGGMLEHGSHLEELPAEAGPGGVQGCREGSSEFPWGGFRGFRGFRVWGFGV